MLNTVVTYPLSRDAGEYYRYAFNLRHNHTYSNQIGKFGNTGPPVTPDAVRSPGYPLFLTLFIDGLSNPKILKNIIYFQMIISMLTLFIGFFFFHSFLSMFWAVTASFLVALSPHLIVANSYVLTETLFCFVLVVLGWLVCVFVKNPSFVLAVLIGCVLGFGSLVRPVLQYFPIVLSFFFIFHHGKGKGTRFFLMTLLGFMLIYAPWIIRNIKTLNIISDKKLMINFLHHGIYPDFTFDQLPESFGFPYQYDPHSNEISNNVGSVLKEVSRRFRLEPLRHLKWYILKKPLAFWSWNIVQGGDVFVYSVSKSPYFTNRYFIWTHALMHALHGMLVWFCFFGSLMAWLPVSIINFSEKSIYVARFASILIIYFTAIHMIGSPFPRYSVPIRPILYGVALIPFHFLFLFLKEYHGNHR